MFAKLEHLERQFEDLEQQLSSPEVFGDQERYRKLTKAHSDLKEIVEVFRVYRQLNEELAGNKEMLRDSDPEIQAMAREEIDAIEKRLPEMEHELKLLLLPKDPLDEKNVVLEIRAGTGGEEAALFAADLFRMYLRYAEDMGWRVEVLSSSETDSGGFKEIIGLISGDKVYSRMKFESGTHRVQRVPATETQGRIHTSAATVAVMPEADEVELDMKPEDLRFDVYRSSGPGGQSVNTTDSAVRVTHIPTGITVACQDEKSQHKNKAKGLKILASRLLQAQEDKRHEELAEQRRSLVGTGDRSGRIRTYNFPQGRITDHRINLTLYKLDAFMEGQIGDMLDALITHAQTEALKAQANVH
ncbi:peptide chain release factor 1 [Oleidesulfovibrio alaskensis G20]|jgi:peptide chain release factor 1|uniref:Peptide chain release factor 1 n=1 Tax=Oleidesulfovibrio alaskensis (strain ATCC BAA-1058 / DSM 17464 / G20) TaxID=207559 RepID=RF1_OLEA2|nr:peptide chain release factor 1 [Oleidesulfovibrio alaskensis]Q30X18.1 RecName: Full=Peptide chain release factor 1; Short=RF-1 [Oleidesulfovibrio alaskensis G20]ABB39778.1 peptide chain release factor 1 [Oleidesulfovibrio alaskensis G20]MBG0774387.1 peptide chain release factor 1 [Oleidesulfovibrio alaskensis]